MSQSVSIPGLAQLRKDMRALGLGLQTELRAAEAEAARVVAEEAAKRAPKGTRPLPANRKLRLADTIRPIPRGTKFYAGATAAKAPHGNVVHWGGTISPRGTPIHFQRRPFLLEAFDAKRDEFQELLLVELDKLAARHGWR